jgi:hypothetical protein
MTRLLSGLRKSASACSQPPEPVNTGAVGEYQPIQNGLCCSLISQNFLPKGDINRCFQRTLRHKRFFGASDTTADQRAGGTFIFEEKNRATFLPQRREASAKIVLACAQK